MLVATCQRCLWEPPVSLIFKSVNEVNMGVVIFSEKKGSINIHSGTELSDLEE